jgi:hypothetical protein
MLCVTATMIFMLFIWAIDISASAMIVSSQANINITLSNALFENTNPNSLYHLALIASIVMFATMTFLTMHYYEEAKTYKDYLEDRK